MKWYFDSAEHLRKLYQVANTWMGTPFMLNAAVRGAGVDCVRFVAEVMKECGQLPHYEFPHYTIDGGDHLKASLVEQWLRPHPLFTGIALDQLRYPGDVMEFRVGRGVTHHVGLYMGDAFQRIWSAAGTDGVQVRTLRDNTWGKRLVRVWRPLEAA